MQRIKDVNTNSTHIIPKTNSITKSLIGEFIQLTQKDKEYLSKLDLITIEDILTYLPYKYNDFKNVTKISTILDMFTKTSDNEYILEKKFLIFGNVTNLETIKLKNNKSIQKGTFKDDSGKINLIWFNQDYIVNALSSNKQENIYLFGKIYKKSSKNLYFAPEKILTSKSKLIGHIIPEYFSINGNYKNTFRTLVQKIINKIQTSNLCNDIEHKILNIIQKIHFPENENDIAKNKKILAIYELINLRLKILESQKQQQILIQTNKIIQIKIPKNIIQNFCNHIGINLTTDQLKCIQQLNSNITNNQAIRTIIYGDVGTGKTIISMYLGYITSIINDYTTVILAPTTILAEQLFRNFINKLKHQE
ncbi:MAG: DEAD/DEAH box helicase family protein, partial [Candidatus Dojkabacteria bacterium]|nr:DEAD/DEAH box helicase family protein [Candidatus Dojkabacteria bacterium]